MKTTKQRKRELELFADDANSDFTINGVRVVFHGEYGEDDGCGMYVYDAERGIEIVMWDIAEWVAEPSLVSVLMEVIDYAQEGGVEAVAGRFKPDYLELNAELEATT